ncbi:MAG TPA: hypothetical protein VMF56_03395 [Acidobacteriaceae bacterium]|nr:hypothetical protein [Acidobacteriaceae bacterium]
MRLPYPTRININHVLIAAAVLLFGQLLDGTDPVFAFLACLALVFSALAFNALDGLATTSGAFVFFMAIPTFAILFFVKLITWEPTNRHFEQPMITITATAIGWAGILAAAGLSRRFSTRRNLVRFTARDLENLKNTSAGLLVIGLFSQILLTNYNTGVNGTIWAALNQLNIFIPMATILATYYEICISRGTRSMNWIVVVSIFYVAGFGFIAASKQGMYAPFFSYFLVCAALEYKFRPLQVMAMIAWLAFALGFLFPWAQYARSMTRQSTLTGTVDATIALLRNPATIPAMYQWYSDSLKKNEDINQVALCYDHPHGLLDRESLICQDDRLIQVTQHTGPAGLGYLVDGFEMVIPHFLWPNRIVLSLGNIYGRETDEANQEDFTTAVAFAPVGDAYRELGWSGIVVVMPILYFFTFIFLNGVFGDARESPWGLVLVAYAAFEAPGLLLPVHPQLWGHYVPLILLVMWITRYVAPQVAVLFGFRKVQAKIVLPGQELVPKAREVRNVL